MSDKKRKRHDARSELPKKKAAITPKGNVKVELLENKSMLGPVLAATPGLKFPSKTAFKPYKHTAILPSGETTEMLYQSSEHPRLDYIAREEKDGSSNSQLKDYIGVYDPATNKLQLVPVNKVTVRSTLRSEVEELREEQETIEAQRSTMTAKRHALAAEFGSKKSRKAIENMTLNSISRGANTDDQDDSIASNVLSGMADLTSAMPTKEQLAAAVDSSKPRPTANISAEYPGDVYTTDAVVGAELMQLLPVKDWVDATEQNISIDLHSKFAARRLASLVKNKQIQKLKVLRFITLAVDFNSALRGGGGKPSKIPPKDKLEALMGNAPSPVVNAIRRKFASENNDMPRWNIDNLMTHVAAAALIVDDLELDVNDLREDLKLESKDIRQYFLELGCRCGPPTEFDRTKYKLNKSETANHFIAKLKLPLQFPKVKVGMNKRR